MMVAIVIIVILLVLVFAIVGAYNGLIASRTRVDESESQIDVQLKRRNDLIPNLVNTVKGSANYEKGTLTQVTEMRNQLASLDFKDHPQEAMKISEELSKNLKMVFNAVSENYPDLKASTSFNNLIEELSNTENKISYARQLYNKCVADFNQQIQTFPTNLLAGMFHFDKRDYLEIPDSEKQAPQVDFSSFDDNSTK